jgi:hypothetical protein
MVAAADCELVEVEVVLAVVDKVLLEARELDCVDMVEDAKDEELEPLTLLEDESPVLLVAELLLSGKLVLDEAEVMLWLTELLVTGEDIEEEPDELVTAALEPGRLDDAEDADEVDELIVTDELKKDDMLDEVEETVDADELNEAVELVDEVEETIDADELKKDDMLDEVEGTVDADELNEAVELVDELACGTQLDDADCMRLVEVGLLCKEGEAPELVFVENVRDELEMIEVVVVPERESGIDAVDDIGDDEDAVTDGEYDDEEDVAGCPDELLAPDEVTALMAELEETKFELSDVDVCAGALLDMLDIEEELLDCA